MKPEQPPLSAQMQMEIAQKRVDCVNQIRKMLHDPGGPGLRMTLEAIVEVCEKYRAPRGGFFTPRDADESDRVHHNAGAGLKVMIAKIWPE